MGTLIGPLSVRRNILIQASADRVWEEFRSLHKVVAWLGIGQNIHEYQPNVGAAFRLSVDIDGVARGFGGTVLNVEEAREISFEIQWDAPSDWVVPTLWTIRLHPLYGGTLVEQFHHGFERLGADAAANLEGYEDGWSNRHLKALRRIVEG